MTVNDLDLNEIYSYADNLKWQLEERIEIIRGHIFKMSSPNFAHQAIVGELHLKTWQFPCQ